MVPLIEPAGRVSAARQQIAPCCAGMPCLVFPVGQAWAHPCCHERAGTGTTTYAQGPRRRWRSRRQPQPAPRPRLPRLPGRLQLRKPQPLPRPQLASLLRRRKHTGMEAGRCTSSCGVRCLCSAFCGCVPGFVGAPAVGPFMHSRAGARVAATLCRMQGTVVRPGGTYPVRWPAPRLKHWQQPGRGRWRSWSRWPDPPPMRPERQRRPPQTSGTCHHWLLQHKRGGGGDHTCRERRGMVSRRPQAASDAACEASARSLGCPTHSSPGPKGCRGYACHGGEGAAAHLGHWRWLSDAAHDLEAMVWQLGLGEGAMRECAWASSMQLAAAAWGDCSTHRPWVPAHLMQTPSAA